MSPSTFSFLLGGANLFGFSSIFFQHFPNIVFGESCRRWDLVARVLQWRSSFTILQILNIFQYLLRVLIWHLIWIWFEGPFTISHISILKYLPRLLILNLILKLIWKFENEGLCSQFHKLSISSNIFSISSQYLPRVLIWNWKVTSTANHHSQKIYL